MKKEHIEKTCEVCGKIFFVQPYRTNARFCCQSCADTGRHGKVRTSKEWLYEKYWVEELTTFEMAELIGVCPQTIANRMYKLDIPVRSLSDANKLAYKNGRCEKFREEGLVARKGKRFAPLTEEHKANLSASLMGKKHSKESRRKMSEGKRRNWADSTSVYHSEGYRQRLSEGIKAAWANPESGFHGEHWYQQQSERMQGKNNISWKGGVSFEPYPPTFNEEFKQKIRERDGCTCAICRLAGNSVHHVNYVKDDTVPENCITLCRPCHGVTNFNRDYWQVALTDLMEARALAAVEL